MLWVLDFDDFRNICGYGAYPIGNLINATLAAAEMCVSVSPPPTKIPAATLPPVTGHYTPNPNPNPNNKPIGGGSEGDNFCSQHTDGMYRHSVECSKFIMHYCRKNHNDRYTVKNRVKYVSVYYEENQC